MEKNIFYRYFSFTANNAPYITLMHLTLLSKATYSAFRLYSFCICSQPFALLTQCSTTEPQEHCTRISCKYSNLLFHPRAFIASTCVSMNRFQCSEYCKRFDARTPANFGKSSDYFIFKCSLHQHLKACDYGIAAHSTDKKWPSNWHAKQPTAIRLAFSI